MITVDPENVRLLVDAMLDDVRAGMPDASGDPVKDFEIATTALLEHAAAMAIASGVLVSSTMEDERVPRTVPALMQQTVSRMTRAIMTEVRVTEAAQKGPT